MCGIGGFFEFNASQACLPRRGVLERLSEQLAHRGPDADGIFESNHVGLIHRRLSLLDLSENGNQPFHSDRYVLVFNGEIFNYRDLKSRYLSHVEHFRSSTDTEVLLLLIESLGLEQTLELIEGMFAFALFDKRTGELTLVRDRLGIKPLYYSQVGHTLWFSSEVKGLAAVLDLEPNPRSVATALFGALEFSEETTSYRNVFKLPPGQLLRCRPNSERGMQVTYFSLTSYVDEDLYLRLGRLSQAEVAAQLQDLLQASITKMLHSDAPVGAFVSGGVDSSLIALIAKECGLSPQLFSVDVVGKLSEISSAQQLAQALGSSLTVECFEPDAFYKGWASATKSYDAPIILNQHAVPFLQLARVTRAAGVKSVLTGEGADELFLGYPVHVRSRLEDALLALVGLSERVLGWARGSVAANLVHDRKLIQSFVLADQMAAKEARLRCYDEAFGFISQRHQRRMQILPIELLRGTLVSLLNRNDMMGMAHSIESRFPFLDENVLRFGINLPLHHKISKSLSLGNVKHPFLRDKVVVRTALSGFVNDRLVKKRKQAFPVRGIFAVTIPDSFFQRGATRDVLDLSAREFSFILGCADRTLRGKLAAIEVWARVCVLKESTSSVTEHVLGNIGKAEP